MRLSKFSFSLILIAGVWNGHAYGGTLQAHPLNHNGYQRPYLVYRPDGVGPHAAMVCVLGGTGSTAESTARDLGWTEEADREHFVVVFPEPLTREPLQPFVKYTNTTFWEMQGSRTHVIPPGARPIDDDGYLMAVLDDALRAASIDRRRVYFTGFSSGSGMAQLLASRHPRAITTIAAVATPLMEPPRSLGRPMPLLYIHGDDDEQFSGFEVNSPDFATTPHGNWVTWGYLDGCHIQRAKKTDWGVQLTWGDCKAGTPVIAMFVKGLGHEYLANAESPWNQKMRHDDPLIFPKITWLFFSALSK